MDNDNFGEGTGRPRPQRDPGTPEFGPSAPTPVRTVRLVAGDFVLTVNPVDGSEIEPRPPGGPGAPAAPAAPIPVRRTAAGRAGHERASQPPVPAGPAARPLPLLERDEQREQVVGLLTRGRSLRVIGPPGAGRTAFLDAVAAECADIAPDGVVRLNGRHRTPTDLLHELFAAVHDAPRHRPGRAELLRHVGEIGAIVAVDDLEFGGAALGELLDAAPECAFVLAATPDVAAPAADARLEEAVLAGLSRAASLELLRRTVDRPLTEEEANWAGDLWFESEGLPLRFVQAGALLRQCDELRARLRDDPDAFEAFAPDDGVEGGEAPLPTLGQGAAPAALLASRLGDCARRTLRFAVALGGEVPHQAHLPALVGDTHADAAVGELMGCGLLSPVGGRHRLAAGVLLQLKEEGYADDAASRAHSAAQHYTWWTAHPSVTPERASAEADAVLAALAALVASKEAGHASAAVLLARSAAPAFAAGLNWGAWERALRIGSEAARIAGEVAQEAYFHHELGVLALCADRMDRARAELETAVGMRGALADKSGTVAGRRALALVDDRQNGRRPAAVVAGATGSATARTRELPASARLLALPPGGAGAYAGLKDSGATSTRPLPLASATLAVPRSVAALRPQPPRRAVLGARRNLVAVGVGALVAVLLGTVVTLGATDGQKPQGNKVRGGQSAPADGGGRAPVADEPVGGGAAAVPDEEAAADVPATAPASSAGTAGTGATASAGQGTAGASSGVPSSGATRPGAGQSTGPGKPSATTGRPSATSGATGRPTPTKVPTATVTGSSSPTSAPPATTTPPVPTTPAAKPDSPAQTTSGATRTTGAALAPADDVSSAPAP